MTNLIAGTESREGSKQFTSINPRTKTAGSIHYPNATLNEIDHAAVAASEAFSVTRLFSAERLAAFLERVATEIEAIGDTLLTTADEETGLGLPRLTGERGRTTGQLRAFATVLREGSYVEAIIDTAQPDRQPAPRPDIRRMLVPIGPVAVFAASNFPFAFSVAGGDTAAAFAAGCPVILKAHPGHPATSELVGRAINRAIEAEGFPTGFFSLLQGNEAEVGQAIVQHPLIEAIAFTGSLRAGRAIYDTAARREKPIPVYAEMGSVNPMVILPDAIQTRSDALAEGLAGSVTLGSGQFCTNPGLVFVIDSPQTQGFIDNFTALMEQRAAGVLLNEAIQRGLSNAITTITAHQGVNVLTGGNSLTAEGFCYANTVMQTDSINFQHDESLQTEHFGPVTMFVVCQSLDDLKHSLERLHGNLTATIHAESTELDTASEIYAILREKVGRLIWNGFPTGVEVVYSMQHGGPYPATTAPATTSVGMTALKRFMRPVAFQNMPDSLLPDALKAANPKGIWRTVDGQFTRA